MKLAICLLVLSNAALTVVSYKLKFEDCGTDIGTVKKVTVSGCTESQDEYCRVERHKENTIGIDFNLKKDVQNMMVDSNALSTSRDSEYTSFPVQVTHKYPCDDHSSGVKCPLSKGHSYHYKGTFNLDLDTGYDDFDLYYRLRDKKTWDIIACVRFRASHFYILHDYQTMPKYRN